jgi:hypothetical protein
MSFRTRGFESHSRRLTRGDKQTSYILKIHEYFCNYLSQNLNNTNHSSSENYSKFRGTNTKDDRYLKSIDDSCNFKEDLTITDITILMLAQIWLRLCQGHL